MLRRFRTPKKESFADNALATISQSYDKFPFIVGGVAGFVAGKVTRKVGKTVAGAIGGAMFIIQLGCRSGYLVVNTKKMNKDARNLERLITEEMQSSRSPLASTVEQAKVAVKENLSGISGFGSGFLTGFFL